MVISDVRVAAGRPVERDAEVLTPEALEFVADLQRRFGGRREELIGRRRERRAEIAQSGRLDFLAETADIRADAGWRVATAPQDLQDRRVEITGPTERKMAINALNSGARVWLADLEDANTPHWSNVVSGQVNLFDAVRGTIAFTGPDGRDYRLREDGKLAVIVVRPRGWHLDEPHVLVDDAPVVAAFVDFGLLLLPQRPSPARARKWPLLLPPEDGKPPGSQVVE